LNWSCYAGLLPGEDVSLPIKSQLKDPLYELLVENASEFAIFFTDPNGAIIDWNIGAERMFGYSSVEAVGQPGAIIFTPEDRAAHIPERETQYAIQHGKSSDDRWHVRKDGSRIYVTGYMFALKDANGQLVAFGKIIRDRTEERRLQAELRRSEERLRIALATACIGIWENDFLTAQLFWSDETKLILGLTTDAKESPHLFLSCVHPEDRDAVRASIENALRQPGDYQGQFRVLHPNGSLHYIAARAKVSFTRESEQSFCERAFGTLIDVTERETQAQKLEEAIGHATRRLQEKVLQLESVCYAMAHHFRAPLRTIQGFGNVLESDYGPRLDDAARDYLRRIRLAGERIDHLVSDLLAYGSGTIRQLANEPVNMSRVAADVQDSLRDLIAETRASIAVGPLQDVCGDEGAVKTVLHALVSNALKFTRPNVPPVVHIHSERRDKIIRIAVEDNGVGIAPHARDKVFELFYRVEPVQVRATGIGLPLAKTMVERMGGSIGFESGPGRGTRFWFELPPVPSDQSGQS
jgi:PAS domain S-box-containing protein